DCAACDRLPVEARLEELVERCKVGFGGCNEYVRIDPVAAEHHRVRVTPISASTGSAAVGSPVIKGSVLLHVNGHLAHSIYPLRDGVDLELDKLGRLPHDLVDSLADRIHGAGALCRLRPGSS